MLCRKWFFKKGTLSPFAGHLFQKLSPQEERDASGKAFSRASLTAEAAVVLPVFLICMVLILHYGAVYRTAMRTSAAMASTAREMAVAAYLKAYDEEDVSGSFLGTAVTAAYASAQVYARSKDLGAIQHSSLLLSSFLEHEDLIDLVLTWQVKSPVGMIRAPGTFFVQRAAVRGWTGRSGSSGVDFNQEDSHSHQHVYVAENGVVYHKDSNCTHIKLAITSVPKEQALNMRNLYGAKYHACELCGRGASGTVYITTDGNRYHSSLECSGLKRTIHTVDLDDVGNLRPCSRCAGGSGAAHGAKEGH